MYKKLLFLVFLVPTLCRGAGTDFCIARSPHRNAQGIWQSPYAFFPTLRYLSNLATNGYFSYRNPDYQQMALLSQQGVLDLPKNSLTHDDDALPVKIIFLGDYMVSKSGNSPHLDAALCALLTSADVIVVNVEAPVVRAEHTKREMSLRFGMSIAYLHHLYNYNPRAHWVFNIANNHAFDTSDASTEDISGLLDTINLIQQHMPAVSIVGTDQASAQSVAVVSLHNVKIGLIGWTEVMNHDALHIKKQIIRADDVTAHAIQEIKKNLHLDVLIGFPHGNEEQSYYPLKSTRDRWLNLMGSNLFDVIVGTGPHVIHPAEKKDDGILFHSIGNFFSPSGPAQTKVGCVPVLTFKAGQTSVQCHYHVHLIEQDEDTVSLCNLEGPQLNNANTLVRLKMIWPTLFGCQNTVVVQPAIPYMKMALVGIAATAGSYYLYKKLR